jgi:hypothetical protein
LLLNTFTPELVGAFILEVQQTTDLQFVSADEPLSTGVDEHLALPVEQISTCTHALRPIPRKNSGRA